MRGILVTFGVLSLRELNREETRKVTNILRILRTRSLSEINPLSRIRKVILENILADLRNQPPRVLGFVASLAPIFRPMTDEARILIYRESAMRASTEASPAQLALVRHLLATQEGRADVAAAELDLVAGLGARKDAAAAVAFYLCHIVSLACMLPYGTTAGPVWALPAALPLAHP